MKILINAVSVKEGGPLTVLVRLLDAMIAQRPDIRWIVAVHEKAVSHLGDRPEVKVVGLTSIDRSPLHLLKYYNLDLPRLAREADVVFSMTNYLPHRRMRQPTVLLQQHAGHFSPEFSRLTLAEAGVLGGLLWRLKTAWTHASVVAADRLIVQTAALADVIATQTRRPRESIGVTHHGVGLVEIAPAPRTTFNDAAPIIGYITKPGVQKNISTVLKAVAELKRRGRMVRLVLTLDPAYHRYPELEAQIAALGIGDRVDNLGNLTAGEIQPAYDSLDAAVFASTVESFGFPMVEAMARGLPLIAADVPGNAEVAGEAGLMFSPFDETVLADRIEALFADRFVYAARSASSLRQAAKFTWPNAAALTLSALTQGAPR